MAKIIFNITEKGAWVEIEQPDGTMKKWDQSLTPEEAAQIQAAGMLMQKGTLLQSTMSSVFFNQNTPSKITQIKQHLDKAEALIRKLFGIAEE